MHTLIARRPFLKKLLLASGALVLPMPEFSHAAAEGEGEWTSLFNSKDLTGWTAKQVTPFWRVEDGTLVGENDEKKTGSMLYTAASYGDFEFEAEVKWEGEIDSGFMIRKPEAQVQIGVSRSLKRDMTGSFYVGGAGYPEASQAKDAARIVKFGDWNKFHIHAKGDTFTVRINDQPASSHTDPKAAGAAPIGLQIHGGLKMKVAFRGLKVRALS